MRHTTLGFAVAAAACAMAGTAIARSLDEEHPATPCEIARLKAHYLTCETLAIEGRLGDSAIRECSGIYEDLKSAAFGGSFGDLHAWFIVARDGARSRAPLFRAQCAGDPAR